MTADGETGKRMERSPREVLKLSPTPGWRD